MDETASVRLKRLRMRSWRRGTKEMDLILGPFADTQLVRLGDADLDRYESLLEENDQDLMAWSMGLAEPPAPLADLFETILAHARERLVSRS
jgi:antitoxin CptB